MKKITDPSEYGRGDHFTTRFAGGAPSLCVAGRLQGEMVPTSRIERIVSPRGYYSRYQSIPVQGRIKRNQVNR